MKTNNSTAKSIPTGAIKQKRSKAIDMYFYWLKDHGEQRQFNIYWEPGKHNLTDYVTKHHTGTHHTIIRPIYLYDANTSPTTVKGCVDILKSTETKRQLVSSYVMNITKLRHTYCGPGTKTGEYTKLVSL